MGSCSSTTTASSFLTDAQLVITEWRPGHCELLPQALFGKRPTEKGPAKGTSPAVDFTLWGPGLRFPGPPDHL